MIQVFPYFLKFKKPFKIASVERLGTHNLYLRFEKNGILGWGEAVFPPYISENQEKALSRIQDLKWEFETEDNLFQIIAENQHILKNEPALACAMETALLSWLANSKGIKLYELLGLTEDQKQTSYTIGISSNENIIQSIHDYPDASYFKLKVNEAEIERMVSCYLEHSNLPFVIDANQGFTSYKNAQYWAEKLWDFGVKYFEQPFHKADFKSHKNLSKSVDIPIIADESFQRIQDLEKVSESFTGINVKIIKSGGLLEAKKSLIEAKNKSLTTILGCMSGSFVSINNAKSISSLADYIDLDGPILISNNPDLNAF
jgi:L-alanine-DL-glutamate epimerase-like enolase superfamily enzyme